MLKLNHTNNWLLGKLMKNKKIDQGTGEHGYHELMLTRNVLLAHLFAGKVPPGDILRHARRYSAVTYWEELLCAAIYPKANQLIAIVSRRQLDGYSGVLRRHGSIEYVRFFIDWGDRKGFQALGLSHFKVCDAADDEDKSRYPFCHLVTTEFDAERYWNSLMKGLQPKVRAILSWNQVPELDADFTPVFGNRVDSQISVDSQKELMLHFEMPLGSDLRDRGQAPCAASAG